jgi:serine/threonine-protein kinase RsbW
VVDDAMETAAVSPGEGAEDFRIELSLRLPRDRLSVPVVRHLTQDALSDIGADPSDSHDIELALAEACANVLDHAGPGDAYDVDVIIGPYNCVIRVVNVGQGFDTQDAPPMADPDAEAGRGVPLMRQLMDGVRVTSEPERGTVVQLVKNLRFDEDAPGRRFQLADASKRQNS